jgi:primosomal protein N'
MCAILTAVIVEKMTIVQTEKGKRETRLIDANLALINRLVYWKRRQKMSKATICDVCKKVMKCDPKCTITINVHPYPDTITYDLCDECTELLKKWLREKERHNETY